MKYDYELGGGAMVIYMGKAYTTGNRRHTEVELFCNGVFYKVVKITEVVKLTEIKL